MNAGSKPREDRKVLTEGRANKAEFQRLQLSNQDAVWRMCRTRVYNNQVFMREESRCQPSCSQIGRWGTNAHDPHGCRYGTLGLRGSKSSNAPSRMSMVAGLVTTCVVAGLIPFTQ
jgi:hypothetical protein